MNVPFCKIFRADKSIASIRPGSRELPPASKLLD